MVSLLDIRSLIGISLLIIEGTISFQRFDFLLEAHYYRRKITMIYQSFLIYNGPSSLGKTNNISTIYFKHFDLIYQRMNLWSYGMVSRC